MFLTVDVGNTQTTLGLLTQDGAVVEKWRMETRHTDTADTLEARIRAFFAMRDCSLAAISKTAIATVVPSLLHSWCRCLTRISGCEPHVVRAATLAPDIIDVPDPSAVGADRAANAVEALRLYGYPCIVVDFGTATNIDVIDARGRFVGGVISPGLMLSAESLFTRAARLSNVPIQMPDSVIGGTSETALQSGLVIGVAAQAEGLVARIKRELGVDECPVVATGGLASTVSQATDCFTSVDPDLTLRGIYQIYKIECEEA
jgi:type III pantothenate kinase